MKCHASVNSNYEEWPRALHIMTANEFLCRILFLHPVQWLIGGAIIGYSIMINSRISDDNLLSDILRVKHKNS